jgi:hypothetical protein
VRAERLFSSHNSVTSAEILLFLGYNGAIRKQDITSIGRTVMAGSGISRFCFSFSSSFSFRRFFAAAEMAYSSVNKIRMKRFVEEGRTGAGTGHAPAAGLLPHHLHHPRGGNSWTSS